MDGLSTAQKFLMGIIAIAFVTTLALPGRQTVPIVNAFTDFTTKNVATAQGRA